MQENINCLILFQTICDPHNNMRDIILVVLYMRPKLIKLNLPLDACLPFPCCPRSIIVYFVLAHLSLQLQQSYIVHW